MMKDLEFCIGRKLVKKMLTKEECEKALMNICSSNAKMEDRKVFYQLINEHFDYPPLTLDEIKANIGTPIWDNEYKGWIVVVFKDFSFDELMVHCYGQERDWDFEYEENRFYRKQVQEDE